MRTGMSTGIDKPAIKPGLDSCSIAAFEAGRKPLLPDARELLPLVERRR